MASYPEHIRNGHRQPLSPAAAVASLLALLGVALIAIMVARGTHRIEWRYPIRADSTTGADSRAPEPILACTATLVGSFRDGCGRR
jgi:hypothetical protein